MCLLPPQCTDPPGRAKRLSVFTLRLEGTGAGVTHTAESCSTVSISVREVEKDETLLTRICVYARVNIFPIVSHSNTHLLKHLHVYNSLTSSCSSTTKAEKHLPPQISLSDCGSAGNQIFTFFQVLLNVPLHAANRPKRLETRFMKPSSWERQPTSKIPFQSLQERQMKTKTT